MLTNKIKYFIQVALMFIVFLIVLLGLIFKFVGEIRSESIKKKAEKIEREKIKTQFTATIEDRYKELKKLYQAGEYDEVLEGIKVFNTHGKSDYKELPQLKKEIQIFYLEKKLNFVSKIQLKEYLQLSKDENKEKNTSTQVFIRTPRYGQYFIYPSDFPILLAGTALSLIGDFSEDILWTSSIDGELGKGSQLTVRLSIGEHQITATGTNGMTTGSMETLIYIRKDPVSMKRGDR